MIALFVSETDNLINQVSSVLAKMNFDVIQYCSPVKALDNIEEINPDVLIINAVDFPRHWKVITQYVRWDMTKNDIIIILLINKEFSHIEADKALKSGTQGLIDLTVSSEIIMSSIKDIFSRYKYADSVNNKMPVNMYDNVQFLFTNPVSEAIITGKVSLLTHDSLTFAPDNPSNVIDLNEGCIIKHCSLKLGNKIIASACRLSAKSNILSLQFVELNNDERKVLSDFLSSVK